MATLAAKTHDGGLAQQLSAPVLKVLSSPQFDWNEVLFGTDALSAAQQRTASTITPYLVQLVTEQVTTETQAEALVNSVISGMQTLNPAVRSADVVAYLNSVVADAPSEIFYLIGLPSLTPQVLAQNLHVAFKGYLTGASPAIQSLFSAGGNTAGSGGTGSGAGSTGSGAAGATSGSGAIGGEGASTAGSGGAGGGPVSGGTAGSGGPGAGATGTGAGAAGSGGGGSGSDGAGAGGSAAGGTTGSGAGSAAGSSAGGAGNGAAGPGNKTGSGGQFAARPLLDVRIPPKGGGSWHVALKGVGTLALVAPSGSLTSGGTLTVETFLPPAGRALPAGGRTLASFRVIFPQKSDTQKSDGPLSVTLSGPSITPTTLVYTVAPPGASPFAGARVRSGRLSLTTKKPLSVVLLTPPWVAAPMFPAHMPRLAPDRRVIDVNGKTQIFASVLVRHGTTYMPVWYAMRALRSLGVHSAWKAGVWTLSPATDAPVSLANLAPGRGRYGIAIGSQTVLRLPGMVAMDPYMHRRMTYLPLGLVMQALHRLGVRSAWNGKVWALAARD